QQQVVVSTPARFGSVSELTESAVGGVAAARSGRSRAARGAGFPYVHALLNEGREAGASPPHSHTQLAWLSEPPPTVVAEGEPGSECAVCAHIASELGASHERAILELDGIVLLAAYGARLPSALLRA